MSHQRRYFVGSSLSDVLAPRINADGVPDLVLSPFSLNFAMSRYLRLWSGTPSSATWPAATQVPIAYAFWIEEPITVYQLGWLNGSGTMTDSTDVGVYDKSWVRKISTTSTARTGVSAIQLVDVADTVLAPGRYYLAATNTGTTANNCSTWASAANAIQLGMQGLFDSATTVGTLPDPLTNMVSAASATGVPYVFIVARPVI